MCRFGVTVNLMIDRKAKVRTLVEGDNGWRTAQRAPIHSLMSREKASVTSNCSGSRVTVERISVSNMRVVLISMCNERSKQQQLDPLQELPTKACCQ
jgi:hypothetical protein